MESIHLESLDRKDVALSKLSLLRKLKTTFSTNRKSTDDTISKKPRWFRRVFLASIFVTTVGIVVLYGTTQILQFYLAYNL